MLLLNSSFRTPRRFQQWLFTGIVWATKGPNLDVQRHVNLQRTASTGIIDDKNKNSYMCLWCSEVLIGSTIAHLLYYRTDRPLLQVMGQLHLLIGRQPDNLLQLLDQVTTTPPVWHPIQLAGTRHIQDGKARLKQRTIRTMCHHHPIVSLLVVVTKYRCVSLLQWISENSHFCTNFVQTSIQTG